MILKEATYKECETCGNMEKVLTQPVFGCDTCRKEIKDDHGISMYVHFKRKSESGNYIFCSWQCLFKKYIKISTKTFDHISFSGIYECEPEQTKEFFEIIRNGMGDKLNFETPKKKGK